MKRVFLSWSAWMVAVAAVVVPPAAYAAQTGGSRQETAYGQEAKSGREAESGREFEPCLDLAGDVESEDGAVVYYGGAGQKVLMRYEDIYYAHDQYELAFQWYKKEGTDYREIAGAVGRSYAVSDIKEDCFGYYRQDISLVSDGETVCTRSVYFFLKNNYGLAVGRLPRYVCYDGALPTLRLETDCEESVKDRVRCQWMCCYYEEKEDVYRLLKGEDRPVFTPKKKWLNRDANTYFYCRVYIDGMEDYVLESDEVCFLPVNEVVDLTEQSYEDSVPAKNPDCYVRRIRGAEDAASLTISLTNSQESHCVVVDKEGHEFYTDAMRGGEFEVKGNECFLVSRLCEENKKFGILTITENDTFTRGVCSLELTTYPDKTDYKYGEAIDMTGVRAVRRYNDGSSEETAEGELSWNKKQVLMPGDNVVVLTDTISGLQTPVSLVVWPEAGAGEKESAR